ncbi:site-specific integrase [Gordonia sp. CPCC 206044]|uniref:tyrosine-type recombinase/integrase n=1 Tax=Gordonia sp. CPCC 206044 TaxID=3140793 RepID=UPI003AF3D8AF
MATIEQYQTSTGAKRWMVRYRTPDQKQTKKRGFTTKRDASAFANTVEVSKMTGAYVAPSAGRATVGDRGGGWLQRQSHLKPSSLRSAEVAWRVHVEPRWSVVAVGDIERSAVSQWVADLAARSGPVTVIRAHSVLAQILDEAVADRLITVNPARGVKLPRKSARARAYLTDGQVWHLAREAGEHNTKVLVLAYCGLRWGELAGLHVADVDMLRRRLHVRRNAVNVGGEIVVGTPKTHEQRSVPFPRFLAEYLARACEGKGRDDIVFANRYGHYAKSPGANTWFSGAVGRCQAESEDFPRVTPHDLRHSAASLAISSGANVKVVQRMLGHKSATMTLDTYADLFPDDLDSVADAHDARVTKCAQNVPTGADSGLATGL